MTITNGEGMAAAESLTRAIASRDRDAFDRIYDDDVVVWHNFSNRTQTKAQNVDLLAKIFSVSSALEYQNITRLPTPEGFVQYHDLTGTFTDGEPIPPVRACIVATVQGGRIRRLNEWLDSAQFGEIWKRIRTL